MHLLAEVADATLGSWVNVAIVLTGLVGNVVAIWVATRPRPAIHEAYATKAELAAQEGRQNASLRALESRHATESALLHKRISSLRDDLTESGEERAERILAAVAELSRTVKADVSGAHNRITSAEREISRLDERTAPHRG